MAGRHRQTRAPARGRHRKPPERGHLVLPSLAAAAVLGLGGVGASAALGGGSDVHSFDRPRALPTVALAPLPTPTTAAAAPASPVQPSTVAATVAVPATLALTVTGRVAWVQVVGPRHKVLYAGLLRHGRTVTFRQRPLWVTVGDAGAVRLVLRGHARPAGKAGQVLRFTVR